MRGRVIDSNVVIAIWHGRVPDPVARRVQSEADARPAVETWLALHPDDGLVSPVRLEHDLRPRGAVDCLIRAICFRLTLDLSTRDTGVPPV